MSETNPKILIVDDDDDVRSLLGSILESHGEVTIVSVDDGNKALEELKSQGDIDMVISDYQMPGMTGVELYKQAKEISPDLPFLMITGHHKEMDAGDDGSLLDVGSLIEKPFHPDRFYNFLR